MDAALLYCRKFRRNLHHQHTLYAGGVGLVAGLATYGYRILRVLGVKVAKLSNTRGFCCELSAAIVVLVASRYGEHPTLASTIMLVKWVIEYTARWWWNAFCWWFHKNYLDHFIPNYYSYDICKSVLKTWDGAVITGLPVSTTQIITGALITIGLFEGIKGVNWREIAKVHI